MSFFARFRFSPLMTIASLLLASVMFWCSHWQWQRYKEKLKLVATYEVNRTSESGKFPADGRKLEDFEPLVNRRVSLSGDWDYSHQLIVTNQRHVSGPGHHLFTPLKVDGTDICVLVNRGFIPFSDWKPDDLAKYSFASHETFDAVVQKSRKSSLLGPQNPEAGPEKPWQHKWFFPEIDKIARQIPCPIIDVIYLDKIGHPGPGGFPAPDIRVEVPPQTHLGYTIEWFVLGVIALLIGFLIQTFSPKT